MRGREWDRQLPRDCAHAEPFLDQFRNSPFMFVKRVRPSQLDTPCPSCRESCVDALANYLPFKLGDRAKDIKLELRRGILVSGVYALRAANQGDFVGFKFTDELSKMSERPAQAIQLVTDNHIDLASSNFVHQSI